MKLKLGNSIYQQKVGGSKLSVEDGMLINRKPVGKMGITKAVELKHSMEEAVKVSRMAEAVYLGNIRSK